MDNTDWSLFRLLVETGQVDPDIAGGRALHYASCADSDVVTTRFLLQWGASPKNKRTDLNSIVDLGVLEVLLHHGVDPNDRTHGPPISFMRRNSLPRVCLLMRHGANLHVGNRWKSVLYCLGTEENANMIEEILAFQSYPNQPRIIARVLKILSDNNRYDALQTVLEAIPEPVIPTSPPGSPPSVTKIAPDTAYFLFGYSRHFFQS
ncbi:hypothetical protein HK102_009737 [Quaeritorhiza haematococci]|nr:hypothetical protein HK102_009737 [Quaeritorhiza haematococci]